MDNNNNDEQQQQQAAQAAAVGHNMEIEDDHDEDDDEEDDGIERDADGVLDGGVAGVSNHVANADDSSTGAAAAVRRRSSDCDLILYVVCAENMDDIAPKHSILKEGVVVSIGLDKNTKLGSVFRRFAEFCNEHSSSPAVNNNKGHNMYQHKVDESDLEFFHCQLLSATDTAESSALMKNDRIKVRRERAAERHAQSELKRIQRESDKEYFKQLSNLMPSISAVDNEDCDVVFDCQGKNDDDDDVNEWKTRKQLFASNRVPGHSVILSKRCKWLGELIEETRLENLHVMRFTPDVGGGAVKEEEEPPTQQHNRIEFPAGHIVANTSSTLQEDNEEGQRQHSSSRRRANSEDNEEASDEDDDEIGVLPYPVQNRPPHAAVQRGGATEIEDDDNEEEDDDGTDVDSMAAVGTSPIAVRNPSVGSVREATRADRLVVAIPKHSPEAMKLLLEYCYTNRVISLGHDAFVQACRTKPVKPNGPVSPYSSSRRWPHNGVPQVTFAVAVAGIALAEEACMRRFSLMCEVAASRLVNSTNVVEALSMCTLQQGRTGNPLPRLREVAISAILRFGPRGVYDMPRFQKAMEGRTTSIIPTLFTGTVQAIDSNENKSKAEHKKRERSAIAESYFVQCDRQDLLKRDRERKTRRQERDGRADEDYGVLVKSEEDEDFYCDPVHSSSWAAESARQSLKRMSHHLNAGSNFNIGRRGDLFTTGRRRSRRRSSGRN